MYGASVTTKGEALLVKLTAGDSLVIKQVVFGSGKLGDADPRDRKELISPVAVGTFTQPVIEGNLLSMKVQYRNDLNGGLTRDFLLNEFGVYAEDPDEGEILFYYGSLGDYPQPVRAYSGGAVDVRDFPMNILVTAAVNPVAYNPPSAWVTSGEVEEYVSLTVLPLVAAQAGKVVTSHNTDSLAHASLQNAIANYEGRLKRLESALLHNITGNAYLIEFAHLDNLLVEGVWNAPMQRIEF